MLLDKMFESVVDEIKFLRWALLPPYCENLDEDEKSSADYVQYYSANIDRCIADTSAYLSALDALYDDEQSLEAVFAARARFAETFPFCADELRGTGGDDLQPYRAFMAATYRKDTAGRNLQGSIARYLELLEGIREG